MKFSGRELKDLGCPQDKIKFFVDKEFASEAELLESIKNFRKNPTRTDEEKEIDRILKDDPDCAFNVLFELNCFPGNVVPSKRQLRQWLEQGAIRLNGKTPQPENHTEFPITELVFFKGAKTQTTFK